MPTSQLPLSICRSCLRNVLRRQQRAFRPLTIRNASSSSTTNPNKPIVLEQPDKFRPPSHPQRLSKRPPRMSGYNQGVTERERLEQKTRAYPHMFPNEGTFMHWFLTNRAIHVWITLGTLCILAGISLTTSFVRTSPFAHLLPELRTFPFHPINYISESLSVIRLHIDYQTQQTADSRAKNVLDAQKRRLYRRAHGMENLDAEEEQGIDVRGLVPWDDGLTNKERAAGGREERKTLSEVVNSSSRADDASPKAESIARTETQAPPPEMRKRKVWFGIW